jgi:hypothetical protein
LPFIGVSCISLDRAVHSKIGATSVHPEVAHVLLVVSRVQQSSSQLLRDLARHEGKSFLSCYVPLTRSGKDVRQNAIHLKNCQRAIAAVGESGELDALTTATATRELASAVLTAQNPRAPRPAAGLAIFASPDGCVTLESPAPFVPLVTIGPRFYIVPLAPCTTAAPPVFVLALSRHAVRVVERTSGREIDLPPDVPRSLTDAVGEERRAASLQQHSVGTGSVFHGHGEGDDDVLPEIETFCRRISNSLAGSIDRAGATLLLAGDVQITSVFRRAASGWSLLEDQIHGSHDRTSAAELAALAEPVVTAWQSGADAELRALYGARCADRRASDDPAEIAAAARLGRIDTLLLDAAAALDEPRRRAAREPHMIQPEGPFNSEAVLTLRCGGNVRLVAPAAMPTDAPQAAIYRF